MKKIKITNEEEALAAVKQNGSALLYVPPGLITTELFLEAIKTDFLPLCYIPLSEFITEEVWLEVVRQDGSWLESVPEKFRTQEVCFEAVKQNGNLLRYVPKKLRTVGICLEAAKEWLAVVPEELRIEVHSMLAAELANSEHGE